MPRMSVYYSLGVRRVVNACGIYTDLGGSVLSPAAWAAADEANATWASMDELLDASGARIAVVVRRPRPRGWSRARRRGSRWRWGRASRAGTAR